MAAQSTMRTSVVRYCHHTVHPWTGSCLHCALNILARSAVASVSQFGVLHGIGALIKMSRSGASLQQLKDYVIETLRTSLFVCLFFTTSLYLTCMFRALLGTYYEWSTIFLPGVFGASALALENPKRWNIVDFLSGNSLLERMLLVFSRDTGIPLSPALLTGIFMVGSAVLMYLLRHPDLYNLIRSGDNTWFYYPPPRTGKSEDDDNSLSALKKQLKLATQLLAMGVSLQAVQVVAKYVFRPVTMVRRFAQPRTYSMGLFLGGHAALYTVSCWGLRRMLGRDAPWLSLPAGFLAGVAFRVFADPSYSTIPITVIIQILLKWFCKRTQPAKKHLSVWKIMFFCISFAYLGHVFYVDGDSSPRWSSTSIAKLSGGVAPDIRLRVMKLWQSHRFHILQAGL